MSLSQNKKPLVVITGASSGIGEQTAIDFAANGHPLLLIGRRLERMQKLNLKNTVCEKCDVTDLECFSKAIEKAESLYGPVDLLVNNAGIMLLDKFSTQDPKKYNEMINVNIIGVMNGIHLVLDGMIKRKSGTIINISSIAGIKSFPNHVAYCATKSAICMLSEALREEVASDGVRVCSINPGVVETELLAHNSKEIIENYNEFKKTLAGVLQSKDISNCIRFVYEMPLHCCIREITVGPTTQVS